ADDGKGHVLRHALADQVSAQSGAGVVALALPRPGQQQVGQPLRAVLLTVTPRRRVRSEETHQMRRQLPRLAAARPPIQPAGGVRSEEHTSELQSREKLVCRLLLEKKR